MISMIPSGIFLYKCQMSIGPHSFPKFSFVIWKRKFWREKIYLAKEFFQCNFQHFRKVRYVRHETFSKKKLLIFLVIVFTASITIAQLEIIYGYKSLGYPEREQFYGILYSNILRRFGFYANFRRYRFELFGENLAETMMKTLSVIFLSMIFYKKFKDRNVIQRHRKLKTNENSERFKK
jgi:hypothetical protein